MDRIFGAAAYIIFILLFFGLPVIFTLYETAELVIAAKAPPGEMISRRIRNCIIDTIVIFAALIYEAVYLSLLKSIDFAGDWQTQLYNEEMHNPVYNGSIPTLVLLLVLALIGYYVMNIIRINETPPLIPVLSMSAMYMGIALVLVFTVHVFDFSKPLSLDLILWLPPLNLILMTARMIISAVRDMRPRLTG